MNEVTDILLPGEPAEPDAVLTQSQVLMFAPLDKRAFGAAIGTAAGLCIFAVTALDLLIEHQPDIQLELLSQFFTGYSVTWSGALVGAGWGFFSGFCAGWFTAFVRNLALALSLFILRSRAELSYSRDFLDHI